MYPRLVLVISAGGVVAMTEEELMIVVMMVMMMFSRGKGGGDKFRSAGSCVQEWAVPWYKCLWQCTWSSGHSNSFL